MTFLIKKHLTRRAALRGAFQGTSVAVALPFLDCVLNDSGTALAAGGSLPVRFGTWFWGVGHNPGRGIGPKAGPDYVFLEECQPIVPYKKDINYFSNFNTPLDGRRLSVHFTGWVACRTGTVPVGGEIPAPTLDVLVADVIGGKSRFRSIDVSSTGDAKDSYTYRNSGSHNAGEVSPLGLYARLFGPGFADPNAATFVPDPAALARKSVLSSVNEQMKDYVKHVGTADKARLDEYFTSIRQVEKQLDIQLQKPDPLDACKVVSSPAEGKVGDELELVLANHKIMSNMMAMAVACDQTRIFNMLYSQSLSRLHRRGETFIHHALTHEEPTDPKLGYQAAVAWYNIKSMDAMADFIAAFAGIKEGAGTLLDNVLIFANSDTNFARLHAVDGVPVMTVGRAGGKIKSGIHVAGNGDPITRIGLTVMQAMDVAVENWGTGSLRTAKPITEIQA